MNTANNTLDGLDAETIAHYIAKAGKSISVMRALLAQNGLTLEGLTDLRQNTFYPEVWTLTPEGVTVERKAINDWPEWTLMSVAHPAYGLRNAPPPPSMEQVDKQLGDAVMDTIRQQVLDFSPWLEGEAPNVVRLDKESERRLRCVIGDVKFIDMIGKSGPISLRIIRGKSIRVMHYSGEDAYRRWEQQYLENEKVAPLSSMKIVEDPTLPKDVIELRSGSSVVRAMLTPEVKHCEECGGPDVYHQVTCSKVRDLL